MIPIPILGGQYLAKHKTCPKKKSIVCPPDNSTHIKFTKEIEIPDGGEECSTFGETKNCHPTKTTLCENPGNPWDTINSNLSVIVNSTLTTIANSSFIGIAVNPDLASKAINDGLAVKPQITEFLDPSCSNHMNNSGIAAVTLMGVLAITLFILCTLGFVLSRIKRHRQAFNIDSNSLFTEALTIPPSQVAVPNPYLPNPAHLGIPAASTPQVLLPNPYPSNFTHVGMLARISRVIPLPPAEFPPLFTDIQPPPQIGRQVSIAQLGQPISYYPEYSSDVYPQQPAFFVDATPGLDVIQPRFS